MINIEVKITTEGFTNVDTVKSIIDVLDTLRFKQGTPSVTIALSSDNVSGLNSNSIIPAGDIMDLMEDDEQVTYTT